MITMKRLRYALLFSALAIATGGHVLEAYVSPTLEVMVTVDPVTMQKRFDPDTDLTLIDPTPANAQEK